LNGSLVSTYTISANSSLFFGTNKKWYIGGSSMNNAFNGYIDEFRIIRCDVRYTTNYTMPIAPYNTDDKTILLLHFNGNNNDTMLLDSSETSYCVTATTNNTVNCVFGSSAVLSTTQTRGGHSTSLYNDGTLNGSVSCIIDTSAHHGYPLFLGQYCDFCLELWVYVTNQTGTICTLVQTSTGKATFKPTFDTVSVILNKGETNSFTLSAVSVNVNAWNHIAIIRNECGHRLSINGILQTQSYNMSDTIMRIGDVRLIIGSSNASSAVQQYIDAIRLTHGNARYTTDFTPSSLINDADTTWLWIFNGSVGDTWVKELSNNTIAIKTANCYSVIDGVFITPYVNNSTTQYKFGSSSLTLPNQYRITLPYHVFPTGLQDFTIDFWMYATSVIGSQYVVDGRIGGDGAYPTIIIMNSSLVYWTNGSSKITTPFSSINIWKHIAVVRNNSITTMYIDGVNVGSATDTTVYLPSLLGIFSSFAIYPAFTGYIDEFRVSNTARWTTNFILATTPFGNTYVTGPYKVLTTDNSQIDVSNFGVIDNCFIDANMPPGTSIKYLISFDGRITWQSWSGTAWNVVDITDIETSGNTKNQIEIGLRSWSNTLGTSIDVAVSMSTTNTNNTPEINNITITYGTYNLLRPGIDYTISRLFNSGVQQLTFTRLKNGNANHVLDIG
jgi:hypothetical protein